VCLVTANPGLSKYGYDNALRAFDASLCRLGLEYLDLFMLHWPVPSNFETTMQSWKAAEKLLAEGRTRAIGVANFTPTYLKQLADRTEVTPAVNQVEVHPLFTQKELYEANARLGIVTQAWSPIGGSVRKFGDPSKVSDPLTHPTIAGLAQKYRKTPAQVVLRWHLEQGRSAVPKSFRPERIAENFNIFDFALTADDLGAIDALDTGRRSGADPEVMDATRLAVTIED
jgi:diketogulonate reductase-like aldo/keto reductase